MHTAQGYPNSTVGLLPAAEHRPLILRKSKYSLLQCTDWLRRYCCLIDTRIQNALNNETLMDPAINSVGQHKLWTICFISCIWQDRSENANKNSDTLQQWRTQEFCSGGGSTNSVEGRGQRERGSGGGGPLVRGSGGSCNLVQEISFHIVKFS